MSKLARPRLAHQDCYKSPEASRKENCHIPRTGNDKSSGLFNHNPRTLVSIDPDLRHSEEWFPIQKLSKPRWILSPVWKQNKRHSHSHKSLLQTPRICTHWEKMDKGARGFGKQSDAHPGSRAGPCAWPERQSWKWQKTPGNTQTLLWDQSMEPY